MNKKWFGTALAAVMMGTVLTGCGSDSASGQSDTTKQELHLTMGDDLPSADIAKATDQYSFNILSNTMEGLVRLDKDGKAVPGMATDWEIGQDGKTYTFHLRDAKWSNGDVVTANDFVYSWKRTLDPKTASQYAFMMQSVKGATEYNSGKGADSEVGIQAKDDKTLVITLNNPTPYFLNQMAFPTFFPLNQKYVESKGKDFGTSVETALSNGPFKLSDWQHETSVTIEKNGDYWDAGTVKLQNVTFNVVKDSGAMANMYEAGQIDRFGLVRDLIDQYKDKPEEYSVESELTNGYLIFNPAVKGLENTKIRTALTWAVDRDMYADIIYHNGTKGATGFVPDGTSDSNNGEFRKLAGDTLTKHSEADAKALLAEGLKEAGLQAGDLQLKLLIDDTDLAKKAGEFLKEQWRTKLGVDVAIENTPFKLRLEKERKMDYQISITLWGADYNDPMTFLDMFVTNNEFNKVKYSNPEYDKLISAAKVSADPKQRAQLLVEAEKTLMQDMPVGPVFFRGKAFATKPYVKDLISFPFGVDYELKHTYIQSK
jgi:oligopeptide transport system substrate-binding protein